jgi:hypothetical protein
MKYDLERLITIPILYVAAAIGIEVKNNKAMCFKSMIIIPQVYHIVGNYWHCFGVVKEECFIDGVRLRFYTITAWDRHGQPPGRHHPYGTSPERQLRKGQGIFICLAKTSGAIGIELVLVAMGMRLSAAYKGVNQY